MSTKYFNFKVKAYVDKIKKVKSIFWFKIILFRFDQNF